MPVHIDTIAATPIVLKQSLVSTITENNSAPQSPTDSLQETCLEAKRELKRRNNFVFKSIADDLMVPESF
ncbi:UNVERIFIED_CONTAM: hypothetical protein HDU68_012768 [Siphonaria sp. JEL0065]|nr:hypothetical protein HDU68_012768 [Siphonaria sp. JEL0065]